MVERRQQLVFPLEPPAGWSVRAVVQAERHPPLEHQIPRDKQRSLVTRGDEAFDVELLAERRGGELKQPGGIGRRRRRFERVFRSHEALER